MATRKNTFLLKRSNVPGKVPLPGDLRLGELALNTADVILYTSGTTKNQIIPIGWDRIHRTGDTVTGDFVFYGDISISGSSLPNGYALSVTGDTNITNNLYVGNTITATTIGTSGNCIDDIYVSNIHSCSPLNINPLDEGNVYFGSTSGVTFDLTNKKVGIGTTTPNAKLHINNTTSGNTFLAEDSTNPDSSPFVIDTNGNTGIGTLFPTAKLDVRGNTIISSGLTATTINVPPLADNKIVYTTNNGRLTTTSNFTYNQFNNTFSVNNINVNGNVNITGNTIQSGNTNQIGNITLNGNVTQVGDYYITGNTNQIGNVTMSGNTFITGNTNQIGSFYLSGNTGCTLDVYGNVCIDGDINITGSTTQIGDVFLSGNTNQLGYFYIVSATTGCTFAVTGNTCLNGDLDIVGNTFMSGDFCMNNMNSGGLPTGTNCLDTTLIPTGVTVTHQFQGESGILAHIGDLASGEPNSRGYTYFENNPTLTSFVAVGVGNYTPIIGAPQTFGSYNNLFTVTTGATSATIHNLIYNLPTASGATSATYLKFTVSLSLTNGNNQALTFQVRRKRGAVFSFIPIGMSINPNSGLATSVTFNGISDAWHLDEFQVVVKNDSGANPANSIRITDMSFSMFT